MADDKADTDVDDLLSWQQHPHTRKFIREQHEYLNTLRNQLFRVAESSTDPNVRHAAIAYRTTEQFLEILEGRRK